MTPPKVPTPENERRRRLRFLRRGRARDEALRAERAAPALAMLLELHDVTEADVRAWAKLHRIPMPFDGSVPRSLVEYYLLATRHRGTVLLGRPSS